MSQTLIIIGLFIVAIALTAFFTALFVESASNKEENKKLRAASDLSDHWLGQFIKSCGDSYLLSLQLKSIIFAIWRSNTIDRNADDVIKWIKEAQKTISDLESQLNVSKITYREARLERP